MSYDSAANDDAIRDSQGRPLPRSVVDELRTASMRIRPAVVAARVWERLFTEDDRQRLGGDIQECWPLLGTARMWREARGGSIEQAIIGVAEGVNLMDAATARWLRRELGEEEGSTTAEDEHPTWNVDRGELRFGGQLIRRLRVLQRPTNIQQILDEFEAAEWPSRIDNPLSLGQEQLHQALRSLNRGLDLIRFHGQEGAQAGTWTRI